ncbi:glucans biosynthesis protein [Humitalea rosea]|uniref:Glucans biosynthesis protein n=1 Tax=Humitalea rosea TaxID=990373 RepID=A0A2W7J8V6_9PROT|nr:glucan biosynthesis protein G [Humitalea rosea]PZW48296.1 glucans biosynthesis protein [Humitalea rosea]
MQRRQFGVLGSAALLVAVVDTGSSTDATAQSAAAPVRFDMGSLRGMARELAAQPFRPPETTLPAGLRDLEYDQYRHIRFKREQALWANDGLPFQMQPFHRGFLYPNRIALHEVADGIAHPIRYRADQFDFGPLPRPPDDADLGFAGFRLTHPLNRPDHFDEVCAFLGASYFRGLGKGHIYGLSARGLAIRTGDPKGEEFPLFRAFWIERPVQGAQTMVVHALMDSQSAAAAFRFTIRPGEATIFDVEATIYPRVELPGIGIAPATSMFFFGPNDRVGIDDYRPAVHDSDGLMVTTGQGEQIWRPLSNPRDLQVSAFAETNPRGFGLMQRSRAFTNFQDLEAHYQDRPSLWVEPIGDWGQGEIQLFEIPTNDEIHDNIVAFWRPAQPMRARGEYGLTYRLYWEGARAGNAALAQFTSTRIGVGSEARARRIVLDAVGGRLDALRNGAPFETNVSGSPGEVRNISSEFNPETGGVRIAFELLPGNAPQVELRASLKDAQGPLSEIWLYRWTP